MDSAGLVRLARLGSWVSEKRVLVSGLESGLGDALIGHKLSPLNVYAINGIALARHNEQNP